MLSVHNLHKTFQSSDGTVRAVHRISFEVPEGKFFTLLGPSGCGKTTTLRCIAGLERPDRGTIHLGGRVLSDEHYFRPPSEREIGMVFQSYAIWPHMSVYENVAFPIKYGRKKVPSGQVKERVKTVLDTVQLTGLEKRDASRLSGGQQQRLALARAVIQEPEILLLDEPLCNLDAQLREQMRVELKLFLRRLGITAVYVTHDQVEALSLSDLIAVINQGELVQLGSPRDIYERPVNKFVAEFIGTMNFIPGEVAALDHEKNLCTVLTKGIHQKRLIARMSGKTAALGQEVIVGVRPEDVRVSLNENGLEGQANTWPALVEYATFLGNSIDCLLRADDIPCKCTLQRELGAQMSEGATVWVTINPEQALIIL